MRPAAYCRYSSDEQRQASIRDQLRNIVAHCDRLGWQHPVVFVDEAISGARTDRKGWTDLLAAVDARTIDVVLVDDYYRLGRDHIESAKFIRLLKYRGLRLIGVSDGIDTDRNGYKFEVGLKGLIGEHYLDDLAKATHRGLMGQALAGYSAGGLPYGYTSSSDGTGFRRQVLESEAQWVRFVFARYAAGDSARQIAQQLNARGVPSPRGGTWAHSALYPDAKGVGMLGNALYIGQQVWNRTKWLKEPVSGRRRRTPRPPAEWVITEHPELRIIDDATWRAVQARVQGQRRTTAKREADEGRGAGGRAPKYLLSGLLRCGACGASYVVVDRYRYGCAHNRDRGPAACSNGLRVARARLEAVLLADVREQLLSPAAYAAFEADVRQSMRLARPDPAAARRALAQAKTEAENILAAIRAGIITPMTKAALEEAEERQRAASEELASIERFEPTQMLPRAREIYRSLVARLESIHDVAAAREALRQLLGGEIRLVPEDGELYAEMTSPGLAGACQLSVVAGARTDRNLTRWRLPRRA